MDNMHSLRCRIVRIKDAVKQSIDEDPNKSIRHRAQQLELYPTTFRKNLEKELGLRTYKIQLVQAESSKSHARSMRLKRDPDRRKKIWFDDETHFWFNKQINEIVKKSLLRCRYILKNLRFSVLYGQKKSLARP